MKSFTTFNEDLRKWFGKGKNGDWVRIGTDGEIKGDCAREPGEGKPKCVPRSKAHSMSKDDRAASARKKRRADPVTDRPGTGNKPILVKTDIEEKSAPNNPKLWSKYVSQARSKFDVYPSAYANGWAAKQYKAAGGTWKTVKEGNMKSFKSHMNESVEQVDEALMTTHVVVDTAQGNKVVSMAAGEDAEKSSRMSIASAERPPMSIKDKKTLKVVKLKKPLSRKKADDLMGQPLKENVEQIDEGSTKKIGKEIEDYANKQKRIDPEEKANILKVAAMMKKGDSKGAIKFAKSYASILPDFVVAKVNPTQLEQVEQTDEAKGDLYPKEKPDWEQGLSKDKVPTNVMKVVSKIGKITKKYKANKARISVDRDHKKYIINVEVRDRDLNQDEIFIDQLMDLGYRNNLLQVDVMLDMTPAPKQSIRV